MRNGRTTATVGAASVARARSGAGQFRRPARIRGRSAGDSHTGLRKRPSQRRAHATFDAVLEAAAEVIADRGYAAATTNVIARRAGVSVGSLYQYFPNKVAILVSLLERHIHEVQPVIQRGLALLADPETPFEEALRRLFLQLVAAHDHSPRLHEVLSEEVPHPPSIQRLRQKLEGDYVRQAAEILRSRPDVHAERCDVAAQVLVIVAEAMTYWLSHAAPRSVDRRLYVDEAVRLLGLYVSRRCP